MTDSSAIVERCRLGEMMAKVEDLLNGNAFISFYTLLSTEASSWIRTSVLNSVSAQTPVEMSNRHPKLDTTKTDHVTGLDNQVT